MIGKSVSYVMCEVNTMIGFYTHVVMNKFTHSPDPAPRWRTHFSLGNLTLCLDACPSLEVFVMRSGLGPGRPHSLPLLG
jgi:hypothetical protein